ncbi:MAG: hypothetical protein QOE58_530 [Actinomycetota bacterium]|nr:hypothetical protein [Actinomycetota bacterium]
MDEDLSSTYAAMERNFAANLRVHREGAGVSQEELADRMTARGFGFSQATVWKIEQGKRPVRISEAEALADAIGGLSVQTLLAKPEASRIHANVRASMGRAYDAYEQIKAATQAYLEAQLNLVIAAREARDAGLTAQFGVSDWLSTPPERAVIETRVERDDEEGAFQRTDAMVEELIQVLQARGFQPQLDPAAVEIFGPQTEPARSRLD